LACKHILSGECDRAIVAGVNMITNPYMNVVMSKGISCSYPLSREISFSFFKTISSRYHPRSHSAKTISKVGFCHTMDDQKRLMHRLMAMGVEKGLVWLY
jgi:hypothetical protein